MLQTTGKPEQGAIKAETKIQIKPNPPVIQEKREISGDILSGGQ